MNTFTRIHSPKYRYFIEWIHHTRKYADWWAVHNDDTGSSWPLMEREKLLVMEEFATLQDPTVASLFFDNGIKSIYDLP